MDRNYPTSSFSEQPPPAGQTSAAGWAFERGASAVKASLNYGAETDLLHRQAYTVSQLPGYATTHHPTGLSGIFDTSIHDAVNNTTETSVMNFLTAIESRTAQAAASGTSLLPQFRAASWQTGMHSSTELFVTGTLPTSGTFPPTSALSAYQHPNTFTSRNFVTTPSLTLQDATSNGLLPHDSLLQIKASPGTVPTALAFDRLGSAVLSASIPPQSSTYRSAQESAPHLLQPQFSLLPSALGGVQQASQPFNTSIFTGSTSSLERALQRECSVIKHHQRPSSTQSVQAQLTVPQHSLPTFLSSGISFQERQSILTCSPLGDVTQMSNGGPYQKTSQVSVELTQSYPSVIPSPGYPLSSTKAKNCAVKQPPRSSKNPKPQSIASPMQTPSYTKSALNQSSVTTSQAQIHEVAQIPSLLSVSQSPIIPSVSHGQVFTSSKSDTLPSLYKTLTSFSVPSQTITSDSPTLSYSAGQQHVPPSITDENYSEQTRDMSSANQSQSYSSSISQGLSPVSQSQVSYSSQSQVLPAVSPSESYTSGPSPSLPFSSQVQHLSTSSPTQNFISVCTSQSTSIQKSSSPQSQKFLSPAQSNFTSPGHSQTSLQNRPTSNKESHTKRKNLFASTKHDNEFPVQELQALQQASLDPTTQTLVESEIVGHEATYSVSKADDRFSQSVIRSNSRLEDQAVGLTLQACKKDERMTHLTQQVDHINVHSHDIKKAINPMETLQGNVAAKELSPEQPVVHKAHESKIPEHQNQIIQDHATRHAQQLQLPSTQELLESTCDLHALQQSMLQASLVQTKTSTQTHPIQSPQHTRFLQLDSHIHSNGGQPQQVHPQTSKVIKDDAAETSKHLQQHLPTKSNFTQLNHDSKNPFVSLGSVCFPESMLTDDRNILSNVDDILAATAAACGVPQQEFVKSTSNEESTSLENSEGSKSRFQPIDVRHMTPNFSSSPAMAAKLQNIHNLSLNGSQITVNFASVSSLQSKTISLDQTNIETSAQIVPNEIGSSSSRIMQKEQEQISSMVKNQSSTSQESEEDNISGNGSVSDMKDPDFVSGGKSLNEESATLDNDFNLVVDGKQAKTELQLSLCSGDKGNEEKQDVPPGSLHKKRGKSKVQKSSVEDENGNHAYQSKRPNSKGTDTGLQLSAGDGYDGCHHEERIRQKIKEVEEKQPEVKMGFIGSFIDFIKSGPKQQFSAPAVRMTSRSRRQFPLTFQACYPHLPSKFQPMPTAAVEASGTSPSRQAENEAKKDLETLPSFSSDDDDSVGGSTDLQKSISTALTALDETADKKNRSEAEKVVAVVKQEALLPPSPEMNVQEKPKPAESLIPANSADGLAKSQLTTAVEEYTDEESSDSGGEGTYKERDEFVVKIEDINLLKVALSAGREPPAIWKVQKALLQKFVPEMRNGKREFAATNSYLGYFGDAKTKYKRIYVKFLENANKKEYVRVCSKKPRIKPAQTVRPIHVKLGTERAIDPPALKSPTAKSPAVKTLTAKGPAAKNPTAKGPATKNPTAKGPTAKDPTAKGPIAKDPTAKGPIAKDPAAKGPTAKDPAAKGLLPKVPTAKNPAAKRPTAKNPAAKRPTAKNPSAKRPTAEGPAVQNPAAERPAVQNPAAEGPAVRNPASEEPVVKHPSVKRPAAKRPAAKISSVEPKLKQPKLKAEPPPKKRKTWKEEHSSCHSESSPEAQTDDDELELPPPFVTRFLNTRAMKETFKNYMELLINIALNPDTCQVLEKGNDVPLLPCMKKIDGMLNENRKRLLSKLHLDKSFKHALESFPELRVITREVKTKSGGSAVSKIKMSGKNYNKHTMQMSKTNPKMCQEFAVEPEKIHLYSLYHSLQHQKYHIYLRCKEEVLSLQKRNRDLRPEEILQLCMKNRKWAEELFEKFGELLNHVQQKCL